MDFDETFGALPQQNKNEYLLNSYEMNHFYTLPLDERQAVLNRICNRQERKRGSASVNK